MQWNRLYIPYRKYIFTANQNCRGYFFYLYQKTKKEGISTREEENFRSIKHLTVILFLYFIEIDNPRMIKLIQY